MQARRALLAQYFPHSLYLRTSRSLTKGSNWIRVALDLLPLDGRLSITRVVVYEDIDTQLSAHPLRVECQFTLLWRASS